MPTGDEIRNLLGLYCERIDLGDFEGVGALFHRGVLADDTGRVLARGTDEVAAFYGAGTQRHDGSPRTKHLVTNVILDLDESNGAATARSSYLVLQQVDDSPLQAIITGRYHDRFQRTDDEWHFVERRFLVDLVGDLSRHLAYSIG